MNNFESIEDVIKEKFNAKYETQKNMKGKNERGITLIALVVTIVILIILAVISINVVLNGGLIEKAKTAKEDYISAEERETLELIKALVAAENNGEVSVDKYVEKLISEGITTPDKVKDNGDGSKTVETNSGAEVTVKPNGKTDVIIDIKGGNGGNTGGGPTDKTIPTATIEITKDTMNVGDEFSAKVKQDDDDGSGIEISKCKWVWTESSDDVGEDESAYTGGTFSENPQDIPIDKDKAGTYYLHVLTVNKAGNKKETTSIAVTISEAKKASIDSVLPELPTLGEGMTPVKWNGSSWVETTETDTNWYDYSTTNKRWANVQLDDGSLLVWIPRYAYKITSGWHSNNAGDIDIVFIDTDNKDREKSDTVYDGNYETATKGVSAGGAMKNYVVHPAFEYNGKHLAGIWVGKFETSHTGCTTDKSTGQTGRNGLVAQIKPGVTSWRYLNVNDMYNVCLNMNNEGNPYGLNTNNDKVDPHLMKNSEWGAVAYLTRSPYGKQIRELFINNSSDYITGNSASGTNASATTGITNAYNTAGGQQASASGNIYGVYDMSGGSWEYTASYLDNGDNSLNIYAKDLVSGPDIYKETYTSATNDTSANNYALARNVYGDAIYETSGTGTGHTSWNTDHSDFVFNSSVIFRHGGDCDDGNDAGAFATGCYTGSPSNYTSFRVVIPVM